MSHIVERRHPTDEDIQAVVDGRLDPERHAEIAAHIAEDPELLARVEDMIADTSLLREAAEDLVAQSDAGTEDLRTARLRQTLAERLATRPHARMLAYGRNAAAAAILVAAGWFGHLGYDQWAEPYPTYVADAAGAHAVFGEDRLYPAEFRGEGLTVASAWFAEKLGRGVSPPPLEVLGLELVGARMLGGKEGPLAQYIYEDEGGNRLSLVVKAADAPETRPPIYRDLPDGRASYWSEGGLEYAVISRFSDLGAHLSATEVSRAVIARAQK